MQVTITDSGTANRVAYERSDGSRGGFTFPRKGPFPHDAVHFALEQALGMAHGFWGLIASGMEPDEVQAMAKAGGHASANRAGVPDEAIVELLQAERVVECLEAEIWAGPSDAATFREVARLTCENSHVASPEISDTALAVVRAHIAALQAQWQAGRIAFDWPEPA
ncbi:hypothetical protein [Novosphingobium aquae]|uniref:Uncharacterized protein n=1 Tax=Novosphingobium aquae TaxID=3133435 RepID=A0ABU8S4R1_9SPHN